jgi:hypothetical protein
MMQAKRQRVPGGIRTPNLLIRSQKLYPVELQALVKYNFCISHQCCHSSKIQRDAIGCQIHKKRPMPQQRSAKRGQELILNALKSTLTPRHLSTLRAGHQICNLSTQAKKSPACKNFEVLPQET